MKKLVKGCFIAGLLMMACACGVKQDDTIHVLTREQGSGTRGAFIELFGIEQKDESGQKVDRTYEKAEETNSTSVMITTVSGDPNAIGYISLGSLNSDVKALKIDGAEATVENIKSGTYKVSRPFNVVTKDELSEVANDFLAFILSKQGQEVVEKAGYISEGNTEEYTSSNLSGKVKVAGSSSVTPVMEKLKEAYIALNPNVTIDVQQSDSSTGVTNTIDDLCDIGMSSRELKDSEIAKGVQSTKIAIDGIAVIVNNASEIEGCTSEQITKIFTGEITSFADLK